MFVVVVTVCGDGGCGVAVVVFGGCCGGVSIVMSIDVGGTGVLGGSECGGDNDDDCGAVDVVNVEEEKDEVMVDDDEVSVEVADIVESGSDISRCCLS